MRILVDTEYKRGKFWEGILNFVVAFSDSSDLELLVPINHGVGNQFCTFSLNTQLDPEELKLALLWKDQKSDYLYEVWFHCD